MLVLAVSARATAADPEQLVRRGIELRRHGKDAEALPLFQQAYETEKTPKNLTQIGLAEQALGKWGAADRHLRESIKSQDPWIRRNRGVIDDALKAVRGHVGQLDVRGSPAGAEVRIDGEPIGVLPLPAPVSVTAGGVAIEVRAARYLPIVRASSVSVGALTRETFDLQPLAANAPVERGSTSPTFAEASTFPSSASDGGDLAGGGAARANPPSAGASAPAAESSLRSPRESPEPSKASSDGSLRPIVVLSAAGLALVSATVGVVEHITWQSKASSFENTTGCDSGLAKRGAMGCQALYDDGKRAKALTFLGYGLAAGLTATAVIVHLTAPSPGPEHQKIACAVNVVTPGMGCSVRF